ncbi:SDR family NAD(P)-dependent oxidoreductase [Novosphingobium olei]|uniref:SDR family NAD(P)-dependent oxidoreductase n=1 Tax=Novosphingobium olei TaxID=2728851 RepID=UPI003088D7BC|nr:SDR family NAD(P)-dependent oxidoreductase [Novosphingobium olei]
MTHPAIAPGKTAVITGAADGIGLAAARRLAALGMKVVLIDRNAEKLEAAAAAIGAGAEALVADVSQSAEIDSIAARLHAQGGPVSVLMNNAGTGGGGDALSNPAGWSKVLGVNLMGVLHGVQAFVPAMVAGDAPGLVINTGSKQGITNPPGDTAYNVSKTGVKALTEGLAHTLREATQGRVSAHLLIPGFTWTGMIARHVPTKPAGAWAADQVVDVLLEGVAANRFYLWCLDNETTRETDKKRVLWNAGDITEDRPALSRWHPDFKDAFAAWMAAE